jgi:hypothetical protein
VPSVGEVLVELWPRAQVRGRVTPEVKELTLRFQPADRRAEQPAGQVACPVSEGTFLCSVPAGVLDLRLRAPQAIGRFFLGSETTAGGVLDLGTVSLARGQSIVGRVELLRGLSGKVSDATVRAQPDGQLVADRLLAQTVRVAKNGLFHIDGVAPGTYSLIASRDGGVRSESVLVEVRAGDEVNLLRPLVLNPPRSVEVFVTPDQDPDGNPWSVSLSRSVTASYFETVTSSRASATGRWSSTSVAPGSYELEIATASGETWYRDTVDLRSGDGQRSPVLSSREVKGVLTIGADSPLAATVTFLDLRGLSSAATSNEKGAYVLRLPGGAATKWNVHIDGDEPSVHKFFRDVVVPSSDAKLDFNVSRSVLAGTVVTEAGEPVDAGWVDVSGDDGGGRMTQVPISSSGEFAIYGLDPGSYTLRAVVAEAESVPSTVDVGDDETSPPVRLSVLPAKQVKGMVRSQSGGIPGARVTLLPGGGPPMSVEGRVSDGNGRYVHRLPPSVASFDLAVAAPGFAFMLDHVEYHDKPLLSIVDQRSGTLSLRGSQVDRMVLRHNGARIWVSMLLVPSWTGRMETEHEIVIPAMEAGPWSLCSAERCVDGFLVPFGTLTLDIGS